KAKLALDQLDLNPYLPPEKPAPAAGAKPAAAGGAPSGGAPSGGAPAGGAPAAASDWSDDPIDASGLNAADAQLDLSLRGLKMRKIEIGKSAVSLRLKDGHLGVEMPELALYKGSGKGKLALTPAPSGPGIGMDAAFQLAGVEAEPFLKDAMDLDRFSGTGT